MYFIHAATASDAYHFTTDRRRVHCDPGVNDDIDPCATHRNRAAHGHCHPVADRASDRHSDGSGNRDCDRHGNRDAYPDTGICANPDCGADRSYG